MKQETSIRTTWSPSVRTADTSVKIEPCKNTKHWQRASNVADLYLSETELDDIVMNNKDWETWSPTVDNAGSSGPPTVTQESNFYTVIGNVCYFYFQHLISNANGALGAYTVTLPVTPAIPDQQVVGVGREVSVTGKTVFARWVSSTSSIHLLRHDSINPITTNHRFRLSGSYRIS